MLGDSRADDTQPSTTRPKFKLPEGYNDVQDFLRDMRQEFYDDIQFDRLNREAMLEDSRFLIGDQWDDIVRQRREAARKPVMTINRLPAFVAQIVGSRRLNETDIKIVPDSGGTKDIADIREDLVRNIQKESRANTAYDKALETCVTCGLGNFQVEMNWNPQNIWVQDIGIGMLADPLAVVWDRMLTEPTGRDAKHCFVIDTIKKKEFYHRWPWATAADIVVDVLLRGDLRMNGWIAVDDVRIVNYWRLLTRKRMLAMFKDGSVQDITDKEPEDVLDNIATRNDGSPIMREVERNYTQMYLCSGLDILEGPYELPISRLPVLRVPGWEVSVGEWKHRWGLIRFLKDPQRLHNFWRSVVAERMMQTPRGVWVAPENAVAGREKEWRNSHLSDDPLLIYNSETAQKPERVPPTQLEEALITQAEITTQDIKDVSNIHEANLGMPSNEVSGAAIVARQRVSDTGTVLYHDNLNLAIEEAGRIINELIPFVYDTPRVIKTLGEDGKALLQVINDTSNPASVDLSVGQYSVTAITGPSYMTKRIETQQFMMNLINSLPETASLVADLLVQSMDAPMADKIARRLQLALPPGMLDPQDMTPEMQARAQSQQQTAQQQRQMEIQQAVAEYMKTQSETAMNAARAANFKAESEANTQRIQNESLDTASQVADRELKGSLEAIKVGGAS